MSNVRSKLTPNNRKATGLLLSLVLVLVTASTVIEARAQEGAKEKGRREPQRIVHDGVAIEFTTSPVISGGQNAAELKEGEDVRVQFKITDLATNNPVTALRPAAWMDFRHDGQMKDAKVCREKIQSFLQGTLAARPDVDLNSYYILAMNREPNISVIDPLLGYGKTKLLTLVMLNNPGEDWALAADGKRLFVTVPMSNQVAVVDTTTWKVTASIEAGFRPGRIVFQSDEKYVWVAARGVSGAGSPGGLIAIDAATFKVVARIATGTGPHEMTLSPDDRFVFAANSESGTLSIIAVRGLTKVKDIKIGRAATSLAFSAVGKAVYVADETDGSVTVIDSQSHEVLSRFNLKPGVKVIRFARNSRWGVAVNSKMNTAHVFDAASNKVMHTFEVGPGPDQISFTANYAYVRSTGSDQICLIPLVGLDKGEKIQITKLPAGQSPPDRAGDTSGPNAIVSAPEGGSVFIANPADQNIYYYTEGMAAPMGNFQNYRRQPRGVMVVDRSIRETSPGVYSATVRMPAGGNFDMAFLLDSPRVTHCFDVAVKPDPALASRYADKKVRVEYLMEDSKIRAGEKISFKFKLSDPVTSEPRSGLKDVEVLTMLAPGPWHDRHRAAPVGDGVYEVSFTPPEPGVYYVFIQCPSLKIKLNELPHTILDGRREQPKPADKQ